MSDSASGLLPRPPEGSGSATQQPGRRRLAIAAESFGWILCILAGTVLRLEGWGQYWLNGDEGLYWSIASSEPEAADREIANNPHPPLYDRLLRGLHSLGAGILGLRLVSLLPGILLIPAAAWLARVWAGRWAGLITALLVALSPGGILLSQITRPYMLLVLLITIALAALSVGLATLRARWLALFALTISLAMLVQYATWIVFAGIIAFLSMRLLLRQTSRAELRAQALALAVPVALALFLYVTHVRTWHDSVLREQATDTWLKDCFGFENAFQNVLGSVHISLGRSMKKLVLWLSALALLLSLRRGKPLHPVTILLPTLAAAIVLSGMDVYPLGPTRHSIYWLPLWAVSAGTAVAFLFRSRWTAILGVAATVMLLMPAYRVMTGGVETQLEKLMPERIIPMGIALRIGEALENEVAEGDLVLMDLETRGLTLPLLGETSPLEKLSIRGGNVTAFESRSRFFVLPMIWKLQQPDQVERLLRRLAAQHDPRWKPSSGRKVWLLQGGYPPIVARSLPESAFEPLSFEGVGGGSDTFSLVRLFPEAFASFKAR